MKMQLPLLGTDDAHFSPTATHLSPHSGGRYDIFSGAVIFRAVVCSGSRSCLHRD